MFLGVKYSTLSISIQESKDFSKTDSVPADISCFLKYDQERAVSLAYYIETGRNVAMQRATLKVPVISQFCFADIVS